jgi:hypothetical protein
MSVNVSGAAQFVHVPRGESACPAPACRGVGGATMAGAGSAAVAIGRFGCAVELSRGGAVTGQLNSFQGPVSLESRESIAAFMFRYHAVRRGGLGVVVTGGKARVTTGQRGDRVSFFDATTTATANIFGTDVTKQVGLLALTVPVRLMRVPEDLYFTGGGRSPKWSLRVGVGASVSVARLVF